MSSMRLRNGVSPLLHLEGRIDTAIFAPASNATNILEVIQVTQCAIDRSASMNSHCK